MLSTARCARLTIAPFDGNADYDAEKARFERLVVSTPVHASPAEHQASPDFATSLAKQPWKNAHLHCGNFRGLDPAPQDAGERGCLTTSPTPARPCSRSPSPRPA